jgi:hypothetical protein
MDRMEAYVKTGISTRSLDKGKRWDFHLRNQEEFHAAIRELADQLQVEARQIICGRQVHGSKICKIDKVEKTFQLLEGYDCLMTDQTEVVLATFHADCVPIYLYDHEHHAIAMVHAGWRGTVAGIVGKAVEAMSRTYGTRPEKLFVKIGPCISQAGYEVDRPVIQACEAITGRTGIQESRPGYAYVNLATINREILIRNGVINEKIQEDQIKTDQNPNLFYSHRREGEKAGRMLAWIFLAPKGKRTE